MTDGGGPEPVAADLRADVAATVGKLGDAWEEQARIDRPSWRALGDHGLLGLPLHGEGFVRTAVALEELGASGYAGARAAVGVHGYMGRWYLELLASQEQRDRVLEPGRTGEAVLALALTEEGSGSSLADMTTCAAPAPDGTGGLVLDGTKRFVANGSAADHVLTVARTRTPARPRHPLMDSSLILVDARAPGVRVEPSRMHGWWSADVCTVVFDGVPVPAGSVLGRAHCALAYLSPGLAFERLAAGLLAVGGTRHCLDVLVGHVRGRRVGPGRLADQQVVRHRIAELSSRFEVVRAYAHTIARQHAEGRAITREAAIAKVEATRLELDAARWCLQFHGASGYLAGTTVDRITRDAAASSIAAGPNEVLYDQIFDPGPDDG